MTEIDKLIKHLFYCELSALETWVEVKNRYDNSIDLAYIQFRFREYAKELDNYNYSGIEYP